MSTVKGPLMRLILTLRIFLDRLLPGSQGNVEIAKAGEAPPFQDCIVLGEWGLSLRTVV